MTEAALYSDALHLDEINLILNDHLVWLQSEGREGRRANLSGYDLSGMDLQGVYLPESNMRSTNLTGTNLSEANLQGADLSEAYLERTNLRSAQMEGVNLARSNAPYAYFDNASLIEANMSHMHAEEASFTHALMGGVKFRDAQMQRANFTGADLQYANFRAAHLMECCFDLANMSGADCRDAMMDYGKFKDAILNETNFRNTSLEFVLFTDTDFSFTTDLTVQYQSQSLDAEKKGIEQELENLRAAKDEVVQYEDHVNEQKRDLAEQRKAFLRLGHLEAEISTSLLSYMKLFRNISIFWFVVVALFGTVMGYQISKIGAENLNLLEIVIVSAVLVGVLGAHILSAVLSLNVAKTFARYVRVRRETLSDHPLFEVDDDATEESASGQQSEGSSVTYL